MKKVNLFLALNESCNLDCTYCNVYKTKKQLTFDDCKKAIIYFLKFFKNNNDGYNIYFIGGEPMLSYNIIKKLILFIKELEKKLKKTISISMPSNGTLFNEDNLKFLSLNNVNISISIDSLDLNYEYRNIKNTLTSSNNILIKKLDLLQKFSNILRIKAVIMPDKIKDMKKIFLSMQKLGFNFINMQPAHGVYWSDKDIFDYMKNFIFIKNNLLKNDIKSATFKGSECSDKGCISGCAKGEREICIDSYGNILVCDAFLALTPENRKKFAHDNLFSQKFDISKFNLYKNWKYCNNTIVDGNKNLTNCKKCDETKSCSTLCNAIPNNGEKLDYNILLSNFKLYHSLDKIGI